MVQYVYDDEHHLETLRGWPESDSPIETFTTYYPNGQVHTKTDGNGVVTTYAYDVLGNPDTVATADYPAIDYGYDTAGRMVSLTNQEGAITRFDFDNRGLLQTRTDPLVKTSQFTYYADGRIHTRTDRNNRVLTYTYTPSGKVETITFDSSQTPVTYTYDARDNLTQIHDQTGTTTYTYYKDNRVKTITGPHGITITCQYDAAGNLESLTYPGNKTVTYSYDALNRLKTVTDWQDRTATYTYDQAGRLTGLTQFNGTVVEYSYDNANRLTSLSNLTQEGGTVISGYSYTLDNDGNRVSITQIVPLPLKVSTTIAGYTYNDQKNRLTIAGDNAFTYDDEGQLQTAYGNTLAFDQDHRLESISSNGAENCGFEYTSYGHRIAASRNGTTTRYIHDPSGNLLAQADEDNTILQYYIYGLGLLSMVTPADDVYCYHFDGSGNTTAVTDTDKTVVNKYAYFPFGRISDQEETVTQPFKFVGQHGVMAEPNGWYYMRARYYDPVTGRFISQDPLGFDGGDVNLYAYALNNPITFNDPTGEFINLGAAGVGAVIGGAVGAVNALFNNGDVLHGAAYGAGVGALAGLSFGTSLIANSAIGGTIGVGTDYLIQRRSDPNKDINVTSLVISGISGAIGGGAGAAALKGSASLIDAVIVGGSLSGGVSTGLNYATSSDPNMVPYNSK